MSQFRRRSWPLLDELQKALGLTYLFVSHDLAVVQQISDTVSVMHKGPPGRWRAGRGRSFARPDSDYTRELIDAIPGRACRSLHRPRSPCKVDPMTTRTVAQATGLLHPFARRGRPPPSAIGWPPQQIVHAERCGFDSAWIAQHHFHEGEGGLPAPFVFLAQAAVRTSRIRLGTGIVTLPLELPVRVAEDAAVTDLISGSRLEVGVGPGGNLTAFTAFGLDANDRHKLMDRNLELMRTAWSGGALPGGDKLYPSSPTLVDRIWQATFTVAGARRAGAGRRRADAVAHPAALARRAQGLAGRHPESDDRRLSRGAAQGREPRILASRTVFAADDRKEAMRLAEIGLAKMRHRLAATGNLSSGNLVGDPDPGVRRPYRHARAR